jgi:GntR family transcriptional repressor for pyruvate dehydrogenase complex
MWGERNMSFLEKIKPVEKFVLIDQIIEKIEKLITSGDLNPGDFLPGERILSEKLGVSRTSLRQALKALNVMGVLEILPGKKTYIKESFSDILINPFRFIRAVHSIKIKELFEARCVLEEGFVQMAAKKAKPNDISQIKSYIDYAEKNIDNKDEFVYSEFKFHQYIFEVADNKVLTAVMNSLNELLLVLEKYEKDYLDNSDRALSLQQHKEIYRAIKEKDPEKARDAMRIHLDTMESRLKKMEIQE